MKIFYDTEFHDTEIVNVGPFIDLISIGLVDENGREYYAVNSDADWEAISHHKWLCENVIPRLPLLYKVPVLRNGDSWSFRIDKKNSDVKPRWVIANEVRDFILGVPDPELWAYYSAHDHVALTQLWGPLTNAPAGIPWRTNDIQQLRESLGNPELPKQVFGEHNALEDARWNKAADAFLAEYGQSLHASEAL